MAAEPRPTPGTVPQTLGRLRVALEDAYTRASRDLGLTAQQAELLCAAVDPVPVGELAERLRCDRSNVSRLVDRASRRGLLQRRGTDDDARVSLIELTPSGRLLAQRFITSLERSLDPLLADWSTARQHTAITLMNEIADSLQATADPSPRRRPAPRRAAGTTGQAQSPA